jgi:hypothetical protein
MSIMIDTPTIEIFGFLLLMLRTPAIVGSSTSEEALSSTSITRVSGLHIPSSIDARFFGVE